MKQNKVYIYGKHALLEALTYAPNALNKIYFEPRSLDSALMKRIQQSGIATARLSEGLGKSDMRSGTAHQGIIGQILLSELLTPYQKFLDELVVTPDTVLVLLHGVQDPHNVGAIIRSAAGFGAKGVLIPEDSQAPVTGSVVKVSSGMAFRIPLVVIKDVQRTVSDIKKRGFKVYALAGEGSQPITQEPFIAPTLFIVGNEAKGVPAAMRTWSDNVLSIPLNPQCESLNVAASAAVALYAWSAAHPKALMTKTQG